MLRFVVKGHKGVKRPVMRIALISDIHTDINGTDILQALVARARHLAPDVLLVAGDIATDPVTYLKTLLQLREVVPRLLLVAGNHDVWTTPVAAAAGLDSWARLEKLLPALAKEAGAELLDAAPVVIGGLGFVGSMGWYDFSTREHLLEAPMDAYRKGQWGGLRWMDVERAIWLNQGQRMEPEAVAAKLREALSLQLKTIQANTIVVATHVLAFSAQIHRKEHPGWKFVNAFIGSLALGDLIRADPRVVLAVAGHTHLPSDLRIGHLRALVSPLGYRREWRGNTPEAAVAAAMQLVEIRI